LRIWRIFWLPTSAPRPPARIERPLEYQLVDLLKEEGIGEQESQAIWTLVRLGDEIVDPSRHADAKVRAFMTVPLPFSSQLQRKGASPIGARCAFS
jgi:hypothetical protein